KEEAPIVASVGKLFARRAAKRNPAKHEWPGVVSEFLLARVPLAANELNRLQLLESSLGDANLWKQRSNGCHASSLALILLPSLREFRNEGVQEAVLSAFALLGGGIHLDVGRG